MTISSVTSAASVYQSQGAPAQKAQPAPQAPQDSVHLSPAALKGGGDVDHDGDSH
jgi:hypothetical protein